MAQLAKPYTITLMSFIKRLLLSLAVIGLGFALLATAWAHVGVATIGNRETVKTWLSEGGFYDKVVDIVLESTSKDAYEEGEETFAVSDPKVQAIARDSFSPAFLQENMEKFLDGMYGWLDGDTANPEFVIDLSQAKQRMADGLANYATERAAGLPACTPDQLEGLNDGFDPLTAPCLPPGVSPAQAGAATSEKVLSEDFLVENTLSGEDLKVNDNGQQASLNDSQLGRLPAAYKLATYGPYVFGVLALLLATAVFFLSPTKRLGVRRLGIVFLTSGIILGLTFLAFNRSASWLSGRAEDLSGETGAGRALAAGIVKAVNQDISGLLLWYAVGFLAIGIAGLLLAALYKRPGKNSDKPSEPTPPTDDSPKDEPSKRPAAAQRPKTPRKIQL